MADDSSSSLIDWAPFAGGVAVTAALAAKEGNVARLKEAWKKGAQATRAMNAYSSMLSAQTAKGGLVLPTDLGEQMEGYILKLARHTTGTMERMAHIKSFRDLEGIRKTVPEFYEAVTRHWKALRGFDISEIMQGNALTSAIAENANVLKMKAIHPRHLPAYLKGIGTRRRGGDFSAEFLKFKQSYETAFQIDSANVTAVKRMAKTREGRETAHIIALRLSGGHAAIDIPVMTHNKEFIMPTGTVYSAAGFELGAEEVAPDIYMMRKLQERMAEGVPRVGAERELAGIVREIREKSTYVERYDHPTSPIAKLWQGARSLVEGTTSSQKLQNRINVARAGRDRTSMMPASDRGLVFSRDFEQGLWTQAGGAADDKFYKTFSKHMPLARESIEHRAKVLASGGDRVAHLLTPASAGKGYYEAAMSTGETVANLNVGLIEKEHIEALQKQFTQRMGDMDRRLWLDLAKGDELIMSNEMKDLWKAERQITYTLDEAAGMHAELLRSYESGKALPGGVYLGADPSGAAVFSGKRGGEEFVSSIERREGKIIASVRNVVAPDIGTKVVGTGQTKHTIRQFMSAESQQTLMKWYYMNFKNISEAEADRLSRSINAIAVVGMDKDYAGQLAFKNPEQYTEQLLSELAAIQVRESAGGTPKSAARAAQAANLLKQFGYKEGDESIARWVRTDYSMTGKEVANVFGMARGGVLGEARRNVNLISHEFIRQGPYIQDLGVGKHATFSHEMAEVLMDQGNELAAIDVLSRVQGDKGEVLRGLRQMMEPFGGGAKVGTNLQNLRAEQKLMSSEHFIGDWLAHRGTDFPSGGVVHFGSGLNRRTYELPKGGRASYLQMPTETLASLKGVTLEDGSNAGSMLQAALQNAIRKIDIDISQPANINGQAYWEACEALQEYYDTLGRLVGGKKGAIRGVLGGKVRASSILQASSLPGNLFEHLGEEEAKKAADSLYLTHGAMKNMVGELTAAEESNILKGLGLQGKYGTVMEAFGAGEGIPSLALRYPAETSFNALPIHFRSAEHSLTQALKKDATLSAFKFSDDLIYAHPATFAMMMGDFDADTVHAMMLSSEVAVKDVEEKLGGGLISGFREHYETLLKTAGVKGGKSVFFTDSQERIMSRIMQQQAGKADIGIVSNALSQIRQAARGAVPQGVGGAANIPTDWTALITEATFIKAKHADVDKFYKAYDPDRLINNLKGTGLGMTIKSRTDYLMQNYIRNVINPDLITDAKEKTQAIGALARHETNIRASLEAYDRYKGGSLQRMFNQMKSIADRATGGRATELLRSMETSTDYASLMVSNVLNKGGTRSKIQNILAAPLSALKSVGGLSRGQKAWLGGGLAASIGMALLRPSKELVTPEAVTGQEGRRQGTIKAPPQMQFTPTGRMAPIESGYQTLIKGKIPSDLAPNQLGNAVNQVTGGNTRVNVDDNRKRITREDIRRLRR